MTRVLVTGAGGFIGSHVLRHFLAETDWLVTATDSFRHKGKTDRISVQAPAFGRVVTHDLSAPVSPQMAARIGPADFVVALASQSHVDRSISDPVPFVENNVAVILNTLEYARACGAAHVVVISTDEVYGPVGAGQAHAEWAPVLPSNPYAASKAAQEACATAWWRTYGVPVSIVNCMNLIGELQDREKYLPTLIARISAGQTVTVHGTAADIGTRHYLHARNLADAVLFLLRDAPPAPFPEATRPGRWNVAGPDRVSNLELAQMVAGIVGEPLRYELQDFHSTRPGHDPHYGLDAGKITAAGWKPPVPFTESLERTVRWYLNHPDWLKE